MRKLPFAAACALAALACVSPAGAATFGVADDSPKYAEDGGAAFFRTLRGAGLTETRITVRWDSSRPRTIVERAFLERMFPQAAAHGVSIVFSVYPVYARSLEAPGAAGQFAEFLRLLAQSFPQVDRYIVGNEFNVSRFFQPQFTSDCRPNAGGAYMAVLATAYDALKSVDPTIRVITSVSPRGNDSCDAKSNVSASPCRFIGAMGAAFKAMRRTRPAFDEWASHIYPQRATDPLLKGYQWPNIGFANLDRLKQCVWDAFDGTTQPTFERTFHPGGSLAALAPLALNLTEVGWQVAIVPSARGAYYGTENVTVTDEPSQARIYAELVSRTACDPALSSVLFFGLGDERNLARLQTGLIRADGSHRPSYAAVRNAIARRAGACPQGPVAWRPFTSVRAGAKFEGSPVPKPVQQTYWGFHAWADEDAFYSAGIYPSTAGRELISRSLAGSSSARPVLSAAGPLKAYWTPIVRFASRRLEPGRYVYGIRVWAALNPDRTRLLVSQTFTVGRPGQP